MSSNNRRSFLKQAAAGIAVTGTGALPLVLAEPTVAEPIEETVEERRRLIEEAHFGPKKPASSKIGMAICSHPLATREAVNIFKRGGNACDAAMAASVTQTVVEPHMTTITGCLSLLYYDATTGKTTYVNGNVNAPLKSLPGYNVSDLAAGRGVAVPGWWAGFEAGLERHGTAVTPPAGEVLHDPRGV